MIVKAKFIDADGNPKGRDYTYGCKDDVDVNDTVYTLEGKELVITATGLPESMGEEWGDKLKYLTLDNPIEVLESKPSQEIAVRELSVDANSVIVIEQLPIITEQLKALSAEIDTQIGHVLVLDCTPETKSTIKKNRAALNTIFKSLESRRIAIKKQILAPYEEFDEVYRECVTNKFNVAFETLDGRTGAIDAELKNVLLQEVKDYFAEYALSQSVEWLTFEQAEIKVGLSDNKTALRRLAKEFIDRVKIDIEMIGTQAEAAEMLVEYRKTLNAAQAIKTVKDRIAAVEREKQRQIELVAARDAENERRKAMDSAAPPIAEIKAPVPVAAPDLDPVPEKQYTVAFKATGTQKVIAALSQYLKDNGISYQQIPLKNIMEVE